MSWQDDIRKPSINGVRFEISDSSSSGGNKLEDAKDKETGKVSKPGVINNGHQIKKYSINGFLVGEDYLKQAEKIEIELKKSEEARLIHPLYGNVIVHIESYSFKHVNIKGKMIEFSLSCWEAGKLKYPTSKTDKVGKAVELQKEIDITIKNSFVKEFSVAGRPQFVKDASIGMIEQASQSFDQLSEGVTEYADSIGKSVLESKKLFADAKDLVEKPLDLVNRLQFNLDLAKDFSNDPKDLFKSYKKTKSYAVEKVGFTPLTDTRKQELKNENQLKQVIKVGGLTRSIVQAITISENNSIKNSQEAELIRADLIESLTEVIESTTNDELFIQMMEMKTQVIQAIPGENNSLPRLLSVQVENTVNSLSLSYELNESLENEIDIIERNKIKHPGFITPRKIEVTL